MHNIISSNPRNELSHRERVLQSLAHKEPDRIPIDLGGMDSTSIHAIAYKKLKKHLGITAGVVQINDTYQVLPKVEKEVVERVGADVLPVQFDAREYKTGKLPDGSEAEFPQRWNPETRADGSEVICDSSGGIMAIRPESGYYFEPVSYPLRNAETITDIEKQKHLFDEVDWPFYCDQTLEEMGDRARILFEETDYLIMGNFMVHIFAGGQMLRGFDNFLIDLISRPALAECVLENLTNTFVKRFDNYAKLIGPYVQVINVNDDLGTQENTFISPKLYRKMVKPYHSKLYHYMKSKWPGKIFLHSDGAISSIIPDLIEAGVDIINPVQLSAKGMDPDKLKTEFGDQLTFWGGGCDTQYILPQGTPRMVKDEVKKRIDQLAPGGGFVFCQVHNILPDVPVENIVAMYEAVHEFGYYS
jgi:uroporphyrinogen decarboxylase